MSAMTLLVVLAAAAAVFTLARGIFSMAHGGEADRQQSHVLMFKRVGWQALAVLLVLIVLLIQLA